MATAGRTVIFSATTVALSMAAMVLFPMHFLKSFAYAGVATVAFAAAAAVIVTPAALVLLGDRLDALDVRRFARRVLRRPEPEPVPGRAALLVPLRENRHAPGAAARPGRRRPADRRRPAVPRCAVGLPRRPGAAVVGVGASGRRPAARATSPTTPTPRSPSWCPTRRGLGPAELSALRRRAVPGARRGRGLRSDRHVRRRGRVGPAVGTGRRAGRQRVPHRRQQRAVVLRRVGTPARRAARRRRAPVVAPSR